jgi:hypothetical protein
MRTTDGRAGWGISPAREVITQANKSAKESVSTGGMRSVKKTSRPNSASSVSRRPRVTTASSLSRRSLTRNQLHTPFTPISGSADALREGRRWYRSKGLTKQVTVVRVEQATGRVC